MKSFNIGTLNVELPIVQGGMGVGVSLSGLASAVANEGGIGIISAVGIGMTEPNYRKNFRACNRIALKREIQKARIKSKGIIGVNIMYAISDFDDLLKVALEEEIDVVVIGAGLPLKKPLNMEMSFLEKSKTKIIPKVSSARAARVIFKFWSEKYNRIPDAVVVEGPLAGGHLGFKKNEVVNTKDNLISICKDTIAELDVFEQKYGNEIPIIAGGGIYSGSDIYKIMKAGAKAVMIGSRFVSTHECDVSYKFKEEYLKCMPEDITIIDSPVGLPARVIINNFVRQIQNGSQKPVNCPWKCLKTCDFKKVQFCIAEALFSAANGDFSNGFAFAGFKAPLVNELISVSELVFQLKQEYLLEKYKLKSNEKPLVGVVN
jgi:nitronate monooxygenase